MIVTLLCELPAPPKRVHPAVNDNIIFQVTAVVVFLPTLHNLSLEWLQFLVVGENGSVVFQPVCVCGYLQYF